MSEKNCLLPYVFTASPQEAGGGGQASQGSELKARMDLLHTSPTFAITCVAQDMRPSSILSALKELVFLQ